MAQSKKFESNPIYTDAYPMWIEPLPLHWINKRMMELIQFYVLNSPCKVSSWGRKSMESHGWINYWNSIKFRELIYGAAELNEFHQVDSVTEFKRIWPNITDYYNSKQEFAFFVKADENDPLMNLFHRIRNSFSHGRIRMNGDYIFFEDVCKGVNNNVKVMARVCLKVSTLQNWMRIIGCEDETAKTVQANMGKKKQ